MFVTEIFSAFSDFEEEATTHSRFFRDFSFTIGRKFCVKNCKSNFSWLRFLCVKSIHLRDYFESARGL